MISKNLVVPLLEKQLAAGTIPEYEIDMQAIYTNSPGLFPIVYVATNAEGLDKVSAAVEESLKAAQIVHDRIPGSARGYGQRALGG